MASEGGPEIDPKQSQPRLKVARYVVATQNEDYFNNLTADEQISFGDQASFLPVNIVLCIGLLNRVENSSGISRNIYMFHYSGRDYDTMPKAAKGTITMAEAKAPSTQQRIRIRLKAYDHKVIDQSAKQIVDTALRTGATVAGPIPLPTKRTLYTVVKSPHVYKKGREQFEMRVHKRLIDVLNPTPKTIDSLMNLSLPAGCDAEIKM